MALVSHAANIAWSGQSRWFCHNVNFSQTKGKKKSLFSSRWEFSCIPASLSRLLTSGTTSRGRAGSAGSYADDSTSFIAAGGWRQPLLVVIFSSRFTQLQKNFFLKKTRKRGGATQTWWRRTWSRFDTFWIFEDEKFYSHAGGSETSQEREAKIQWTG